MKRFVYFLLAMTLLMSLLAGCGAAPAPTTVPTEPVAAAAPTEAATVPTEAPTTEPAIPCTNLTLDVSSATVNIFALALFAANSNSLLCSYFSH